MIDIRAIVRQRKRLILTLGALYIFVSLLAYIGAIEVRQISKLKQYISFKNVIHIFHQTNEIDEPDIHLSDLIFGHTGEVSGHDHEDSGNNITTVAIGLGITSKGVRNISESTIAERFQFFYTFMPTFCATASLGYVYAFYLAYDFSDKAYSNGSFTKAFHAEFKKAVSQKCPQEMKVSLHFVQCDHQGKPVWAQNDAMLEAYLDNVDYYYRINDDTHLHTKDWTVAFIKTLTDYSPKNVGVVGPNHSGGNTGILTYDFVHRSHIDIVGYYYPRTITDWWGDDWMTRIYEPGRMKKLHNVTLMHTLGMGQRYGVNGRVGGTWRFQMAKDKIVIARYLNYLNTTDGKQKKDSKNVISMSLYGKDPKYTWGAIRNTQLAPILFPDWKLRFYVLDPQEVSANSNYSVPPRILKKLHQLGAELKPISAAVAEKLPPEFWRYLVIDDADVEFFLIRDSDTRPSEREYFIISEWMKKNKEAAIDKPVLHCIRDHPNHANQSVIEGLWGGDAREIRKSLSSVSIAETIISYLKQDESNNKIANKSVYINSSGDFISEYLWPKMKLKSLCHDGVSCNVWPDSVPIKMDRMPLEYIGQKYDEHHEIIPIPAWNVTGQCSSVVTTTSVPTTTKTTKVATSVTTATATTAKAIVKT